MQYQGNLIELLVDLVDEHLDIYVPEPPQELQVVVQPLKKYFAYDELASLPGINRKNWGSN